MLALRAALSSVAAICVITAAWLLVATAGATAASVGFITIMAIGVMVFV